MTTPADSQPRPWREMGAGIQDATGETVFNEIQDDDLRGLIVKAVNAYDALVEAARFVKAFLVRLEADTPASDPIRKIRERIHAPLHAKLDAALASLPPVPESETK